MNNPTIGVAIITHNSRHHLSRSLPPFLESPLKPRVLVVNSSSEDGTVEVAKNMGAETLVVPRPDFNHGTTRELARQKLNTDIIVMATPDAYPENAQVLEKLINPLRQGKASIAYARQKPHDDADFFESFPRVFNYPSVSHTRGIEDIYKHGIYTFFCSNSCAAYSNAALNEIGGFQSVLLGEDTVAVANLLWKGHKIAYVAEASVKHSHRYTLWEEFRRSFDTGLARKGYHDLIAVGGKDTKRGAAYVKEMAQQLAKNHPHLLPYAFAQSFVKWSGYHIGRISFRAPRWFKKSLSSQDFYWTSNAYLKR